MKIYEGILILTATLGLLCPVIEAAETYHLDDQGWQPVSGTPQGDYLLAVSKIKQQLLSGTGDEVLEALEQLKADFPDIAGTEIDAYIKAEELYSKGQWYKAATEYSKFLDTWPDSVLQSAAMERIYGVATAFLQGQKRSFLKILRLPAFDDGVELMTQLADRAGNAPIGLRALTTLAENQEKRKKMLDAYHTWAEIADKWPTGETGRNALLRMAQALHAAYGGTEYDASVLQSAKTYYEDFTTRYPTAAQDLEIRQTLDLIKEQLAYKEYMMGFYYERTGKPEAAAMYYQRVMADWPGSKAYEMAQARLSPDAAPAVKMTLRRKATNLTAAFLDSWFGIQRIFEAILPAAPQEEGTEEKTIDTITETSTRDLM